MGSFCIVLYCRYPKALNEQIWVSEKSQYSSICLLFLKQMVLVTVEESTWGMTCAFGLIYYCVLGWFFPNLCLAMQLISIFSLSWRPGLRTGFRDFVSKHRNFVTFQ